MRKNQTNPIDAGIAKLREKAERFALCQKVFANLYFTKQHHKYIETGDLSQLKDWEREMIEAELNKK